jgi:hypothetical protein
MVEFYVGSRYFSDMFEHMKTASGKHPSLHRLHGLDLSGKLLG